MSECVKNEGHDMPAPKHTYRGIIGVISHYLQRNRLGEFLVLRGKITPRQLRQILARHRHENRPLGELLIEENIITRGELKFALAAQSTIRICAALVAITSFAAFSSKQAFAGAIKDIPARISLVSASAFSNIHQYPALFGAEEKRSGDLSAFTKWVSMFDRFHADSASNTESIDSWKQNLSKMQGLPLESMAERVNALVNRVPYISDNKNWGRSDYWATPVEFFRRGGDCEDFAIAKYSSLRALGVPEDRMRVAIVKDTQKGIPHAILIVYSDSGPLVLDNQIKTVRRADSIAHYKPIFSISRKAWWLHSAPNGRASNTVIASAE